MQSIEYGNSWRVTALLAAGVLAFAALGADRAYAGENVAEVEESSGAWSTQNWQTPGKPAQVKRYYLEKALKSGFRHLAFDVVEFGDKFAFDEAPIDDNGFPLYGNPFITQGVIYPPGTITIDEDGNATGVIVEQDANGNTVVRPEFPELVLGVWICKGTVFADDGFNIGSGPTVYSNQMFDFRDVSGEFGGISFETSGLELIDLNQPIRRGVTAGTGPYKRARGEMKQTFVGINASSGFALRFKASLR